MASAAQSEATGARRTARKSTAGVPFARTVVQAQSTTQNAVASNTSTTEILTPRRYGFRQRVPARQQPDYVYENDTDAVAAAAVVSTANVAEDDSASSPPRKRGRPPKIATLQGVEVRQSTTNVIDAKTHRVNLQQHGSPQRQATEVPTDVIDYDFSSDREAAQQDDEEKTDDEAEESPTQAAKRDSVSIIRRTGPATVTEPKSRARGGGAETWNHVMNCTEEKAISLCRAADWIYHDQRTSARGIRVVQYNCKFLKRAHWATCRAKLKLIVHSPEQVEMWRFGSHVHVPLNVISQPSAELQQDSESELVSQVKSNEASSVNASSNAKIPNKDDVDRTSGDAAGDTTTFSEEFERVERLLRDGKVPEGGTIVRRTGIIQRVQIDAQTQAFIDAYLKVKPFAKPSAVLEAIQQRGLPVPSLKQLYNRLAKMNRARRIGTVHRSNEQSASNTSDIEVSNRRDEYDDDTNSNDTENQAHLNSTVSNATPSRKSVVVVYPRSVPPPLLNTAESVATAAKQQRPAVASAAQTPKLNEPVHVIKSPVRSNLRKSTGPGATNSSWSGLLDSPADAILKWASARDRQLETILKRMRNEPLDELEAIEMVKGDPRDPANTARRDAALFSLQLHTPIVVQSSGPDESAVTGVSWCLLLSTVAMLKLAAMHKQLLQVDTSVCVLWQQRVRVAMLGTSDSTQQFRCVCLVIYELLPDAAGGSRVQAASNQSVIGTPSTAASAASATAAGNTVQPAGLSHTTLSFILRTFKSAVELVARSIRVQTQTDETTLSETELDVDANAPYQPAAVVCNYDEAIFRAVRSVFGDDLSEKMSNSGHEEEYADDGRAPRIAMCAKQVERDLKAHCPSAVWVMAPFVQKNLKVLSAALNESQFLKGAELFYNEFSDYQGLGSELHKFCVYLKRYWIDEPLRRRWFAGQLPAATAKSNEGLHDRIGLFRDKYRLLFANDADRFLSWICRAVQEWSDSDWHAAVAADSNRRLHVYALEEFLAASAWSNEQFKFIHISVQAGPAGGIASTGGSQQQEVWLIADGTCSKYRKFFDDPTHSAELLYALATDYADITTWKEYRLRRTQLLVVTKQANAVYHCSCVDHVQTALCKHSLGMAIRNGELAVPEDISTLHQNAALSNATPAAAPNAANMVVKKRPPGRPKQTQIAPSSSAAELKSSLASVQQHVHIPEDPTIGIDADLGLQGATDSALDSANLADYYGPGETDANDADEQSDLPI